MTAKNDISAEALSRVESAEVSEQNRLKFVDEKGDPVEFFRQATDVILNGEKARVNRGFAPQILVVNKVNEKYGVTFYAFKENGDSILQDGKFDRFCTNSRLSLFCNVGFGARNFDDESNVDVYNYDGDFVSTFPYHSSDFDYSIIQTVQEIVAPGRSGKNSAEDFIKLYDELMGAEKNDDQKLENLTKYQQKKIDTFKKLIKPLKKYVEESRILREEWEAKKKESQ